MRRLLQVLHYHQMSKQLTFSHFWYFPKNIFSLDGSSSQLESSPGLGVLYHGFWMIRSAGDYPVSVGLLGHMISTISVIWSTAYVHAAFNGFRLMDYNGRIVPPDYRRICPWTSLTKSVLKLFLSFSLLNIFQISTFVTRRDSHPLFDLEDFYYKYMTHW